MLVDRVAERRDDAHGEHEQREGHDGVGDAADDAVGPAAEDSPPRRRRQAAQQKTSATEATAMERSSRVATRTRLKMSRPSWSVPNQCARRRRLAAPSRRCWRADRRARASARRSPPAGTGEQAEGEAGDRVPRQHIAGVAEIIAGSAPRGALRGTGRCATEWRAPSNEVDRVIISCPAARAGRPGRTAGRSRGSARRRGSPW